MTKTYLFKIKVMLIILLIVKKYIYVHGFGNFYTYAIFAILFFLLSLCSGQVLLKASYTRLSKCSLLVLGRWVLFLHNVTQFLIFGKPKCFFHT